MRLRRGAGARSTAPRPTQQRPPEILRIVVEGKGSSGFVEVTSGNTLREVRKLVEEQVAAAPAHFVFLLPDGIPVSRRQERTQSVSSCLPCVTLRAVEPKTGPGE